ncbi:MAG TPA: hypothetical protein PLZ68_05280, partial [Ferruginibacter sp.]|nr:hypothetical protein [Ferruginibacter sp.]
VPPSTHCHAGTEEEKINSLDFRSFFKSNSPMFFSVLPWQYFPHLFTIEIQNKFPKAFSVPPWQYF